MKAPALLNISVAYIRTDNDTEFVFSIYSIRLLLAAAISVKLFCFLVICSK
ncbi:hypothetical protein [Cytobacillus oceanisediminis]|uniref:hypothetical protein n=1 Tax=Cytobacillus oceanisediminis TaxID=665099 RepID=UPI001315A5BB|nr:hypothetical protein [Cytobacillus oceanisediminis]